MPILRATTTNKRRGITLIELNLVLFILVLMSALVAPSIVTVIKTRKLKDLEASIIRLPADARNEAVAKQTPVKIDIENSALVMKLTPADGDPTVVKQIALTSDIQVEAAQQNGQDVSPGAFTWTAYPDGTSDPGGIEFSEGSTEKSLVLKADHDAEWVAGPLPDTSQDKWSAGELMTRS